MKSIYFYSIFLLLGALFFLSCSERGNSSRNDTSIEKQTIEKDLHLNIDQIYTDSSVHFRGLFHLGNTFFISGTDGKLIIKDDQISTAEIYQAKYTDLRDIHVLSDSSILVMGIASPGHIWKIKKGEQTWRKVYSNMDSLVFMDGIDFWNDSVGLAFCDPLDGYHFILKTTDNGNSWYRIDSIKIPSPLFEEAGFAASGTSIQCLENGIAYIGLGGPTARILKSIDYGESWDAIETPILSGEGGKGIYSLSFKDPINGVIVGGYWKEPYCDSSKAYTKDGGKTWKLSEGIQHYRSGVTYLKNDIYISTGTSGTDISYDGGENWTLLDSTGYNSIQFSNDSTGMAVGSRGVIAELTLLNKVK